MPVNIMNLTAELKHHPDQQYSASLLHDLQWGRNIGYTRPRFARITPNLKSAHLHPEAISAALAKEVSNSHTAGPFLSPPIPNLQCSPLGVVPKKDGTWRIIMDLSSPNSSSINDFIPKDDYTLHYASFDETLTLVARYGQKTLMAKLDIKHIFRLCPVRLENCELLGIHWQGKFYIDLRLPFDPAYSSVCAHNVKTILHVASQVGIPLAPNKLEGPTTRLVFLGILINTNCMETVWNILHCNSMS